MYICVRVVQLFGGLVLNLPRCVINTVFSLSHIKYTDEASLALRIATFVMMRQITFEETGIDINFVAVFQTKLHTVKKTYCAQPNCTSF